MQVHTTGSDNAASIAILTITMAVGIRMALQG